MVSATLIISVYNNTEYLRVVLDSVMRQTHRPFDIIVSEDAEHPHMKEFLASYPFELPWQHLTQPDQGWRKNKALNNCIRAATGDYLIFIDGDCVLHPRFVEQHLAHARKNRVLGGKRIKLNQTLTERLLAERPSPDHMNRFLLRHLLTAKKQGLRFAEEGFFWSPAFWPGLMPFLRPMRRLKGCNMSFFKEAIQAINGFDEDYIRPAIGEDIDLMWRFRLAGYQLHSLRNVAVQYHLHHPENWMDQTENLALMVEKQKSGNPWCSNGLLNQSSR